MNHPKPEELSEFLYDELPAARRAEVAQHVESCADCRATVESWRAVRANLAAWKLPASSMAARVAPRRATGALRWAAAAVVLLGAGYGLARMTEKPVDLAALRSDLAREVRQEVRQELTTELTNHAAQQVAWQQDLQQNLVSEISRLDARQIASHVSLRKDLETVALHSQEEVNWLATLASQGKAAEAPVAQ
jgi:hypothetical protein